MEIIDISPTLSESTPVWPGDIPLSRDVQLSIGDGANIELSAIRSTVHIGAHADAPSHYHRDGATIDAVSLDGYFGPCIVTKVSALQIDTPEIEPLLKKPFERILFRTDSFPHSGLFEENFTSFTAAAIQTLGEHGVKLVGIDTPSVDPYSSKDLPAHQTLYRFGMCNLEGLDLSSVAPGEYKLIALPLKLSGFDGSPVRAVLVR